MELIIENNVKQEQRKYVEEVANYFFNIALNPNMKTEETYESLHEYKVEQDRLIAEGKRQKHQIIYGFTPEDWEVVKRGRTAEIVFKELEEKYGL